MKIRHVIGVLLIMCLTFGLGLAPPLVLAGEQATQSDEIGQAGIFDVVYKAYYVVAPGPIIEQVKTPASVFASKLHIDTSCSNPSHRHGIGLASVLLE